MANPGSEAREQGDDLVPFGEYCYHTWAASDPQTRTLYFEMAPSDRCPYWQATDHGTIRCHRIGKEAIVEWVDYRDNLRKAEAALGAEGLARARKTPDCLTDEIKICGINLHIPGWDEPEVNDVLTWRD